MIVEYTMNYQSPLGEILLASDGEALTGLWFQGQKYFPDAFSDKNQTGEPEVFNRVKDWLDAYFRGENPERTFLLAPKGSQFRQKVWDILLKVPYGETTTYGRIAKEMKEETGKSSMSAQAVGGAVGHNPISIIIPCHRVLGSGGDLTGYAGGIEKKKWLLNLEKRVV